MTTNVQLNNNQKKSLSNIRQRIKDQLWLVMLNADAMNRQLGELADYMADYDCDIHAGDVAETMALVQEVRARCGVQIDAVTTPLDKAIENYNNRMIEDQR